MDKFYQKIQSFLMKKDAEVGKLKFLTSRTTEENSRHIGEIVKSIGDIFQTFGVPIKEEASATNEKCIQALKYLILNTNFKAQEFLTEDLLNGHLVDMCPPLSPYLLIEITWSLNYEEILAECILHFPLDLCIEILEILRRCILLLDFQHAFDLLLTLVANCYKKLIIVRDQGTQSISFDVSLDGLVTNYQEFLSFLGDKKYTKLQDVKDVKRSERCGYILKDLLGLTKNCLELAVRGLEVSPEAEKLYRVTFGREPLIKCDAETAARHFKSLDFELTALLLRKIKQVDCNTYLDWASLDADGSPSLSLQQIIGVECFKLSQFIRERSLEGQEHLLECLQQLSVNPSTLNLTATMNFRELCEGVERGNHDCLRELMNQRQNWDRSVFECIRKRVDLFDKEDFFHLLEYLTDLMPKEGQEEYKQMVYNTVTKVLFRQNIKDLYEVALTYILKHDAGDALESAYTEEMFERFILKCSTLRSPNNLRTVLFFLLKNPQKFLTILIKVSIGCSRYRTIMIPPDDLSLLSPIMSIRDNKGKFVLTCLKDIGLSGEEFEPKKFSHFAASMIEHGIVKAAELIHDVYVPWLDMTSLPVTTVKVTLNGVRQIMLTAENVNLELLLKSLAKKMTQLRNDRSVSKYLNSELVTLTTRIVQSVLRTCDNWFGTVERRKWIIELESCLQPIDKFTFSRLFSSADYFDVVEIMQDYDRQICGVLLRITEREEVSVKDVNLGEEIIRHLLLTCTEAEYVRVASEVTVIHGDYFNYADEAEAFDNVIRITIETCAYCLRADVRPDHFASLIKSLSKFARGLIHLEMSTDKKLLLDSLVDHFRKLGGYVQGTEYENLYNEAAVQMNNRPAESVTESLTEVVNLVNNFGDKCLKVQIAKPDKPAGEILWSQIRQEFIRNCLIAAHDSQSCTMRRMRNLLCSIEN